MNRAIKAKAKAMRGIGGIRWSKQTTLAGLIAFALLPTSAWADSRADAASAANRAVRDVLQTEMQPYTERLNRCEALQATLESSNGFSAAHWHAGHVRRGKEWLPFENAIVHEGDDERLTKYHRRRDAAERTFANQLELANWCRKRRLPDQERAHLLHTLVLAAPTQDVDWLYERLGYRRFDTEWLSPQDIVEQQQLQQDLQAGFRKWSPRIQASATRLEASGKKRKESLESLLEITDPKAIPVIERTLCWKNSELALTAVEILGKLRAYQASRSLASQALFSPWKSVRDRSSQILSFRRQEDYVPELLSLLHTPIQSNMRVIGTPGRGLLFQYLWNREAKDEFEVATAQILRTPVLGRRPGGPQDRVNMARFAAEASVLRAREEQFLQDWLYARETQIAQTNDFTGKLNDRIGSILAQVSGQPASTSSSGWWHWWSDFIGYDRVSEKRVVIVDERNVATTTLPPPLPIPSCLVAGSPIWTDHGHRPIEHIRVGDRVLAKNIETGELAYKSVLHTTVRPPSPTFVFTVGDDSITASVGHNFWVSGAGWTKTRELRDGQPLHTATGMTRVSHVETAAEEKTYNLVVADFHTYFVGHTHILSHDVLPPRPTNKLVPGLVDE